MNKVATWMGLVLALTLPMAAPTPAGAFGGPRARVSQTSDVRLRAQRIQSTLRRGRQTGTRATQRYLRAGYQRDLDQLLTNVETNAILSTTDHLRTTGAIARLVIETEREHPGTHSPELLDRAHRAYASSRVKHHVRRHETSVELELDRNDQIVDALTTENGTVGPILRQGGRPVPTWLTQLAREGNVHDIPWDSLSREQKVALINSQARTTFYTNRSVPGVRFRTRLRMTEPAPRDTGRLRVEDNNLIVEDVLMTRVEYESMEALNDFEGVEAHVRQDGPAGPNLRDASVIRSALGHGVTGVHQHITTEIDPQLRAGDAITRISFVDFYRRVNLVAELRVVMSGGLLKPVGRSFDFIRDRQIEALHSHFVALSGGDGHELSESELKLAAVGFRTGRLYNNNMSLMGLEMRTLEATPQDEPFADAVQRGLIGRHYGISNHTYAQWRQRLAQRSARRNVTPQMEGHALGQLHYNRDADEMLAHLPAHITLDNETTLRLIDAMDDSFAPKMLLHDWSNDPVFADDPEALARIAEYQQSALQRFAARRVNIHQAVQEFVRGAGLLHYMESSIGLR